MTNFNHKHSAGKREIIQWLEEVKDDRIVRQFSIVKNSNQNAPLSKRQNKDTDKGLHDMKEGKTYTPEEAAVNSTRKKYPHINSLNAQDKNNLVAQVLDDYHQNIDYLLTFLVC